jgi:anti-anti-sigma regulatory factor
MSEAALRAEEAPVIVVDDPSRPEWSRLVLTGRITVGCAGPLHAAALAISASGNNVSVCCAGVEYLDAAALQVLVCLGRDLVGRGRRCDVTSVPEAVGNWFRCAGLGTGERP